MIYIDESIQEGLGYICVGFACCESDPGEYVAAALASVGLDPVSDEYKSGYRMAGSSVRLELRDKIYQLVLEHCRFGVYVAPLSERAVLLQTSARIAKVLVEKNSLPLVQTVFFDEGLLGKASPHVGLEVIADCDSRVVRGIQLADFVAYHCSYLLKCALVGESKRVPIEESHHPLSGEEVDLDWLLRTDFRRHFFVEYRNEEAIESDDWFFKLAGYGAFFSPNLGDDVRLAAESVFDSMYFGCVW